MRRSFRLSLAALSVSTFAAPLHAAAAPRQGLTHRYHRARTRQPRRLGIASALCGDDQLRRQIEQVWRDPVKPDRHARGLRGERRCARPRAPALPEGVAEISRSNCSGCHDFTANSDRSIVRGRPIAKRGTGPAAALAASIRNGSHGSWGGGSMPPHPRHDGRAGGRHCAMDHDSRPAIRPFNIRSARAAHSAWRRAASRGRVPAWCCPHTTQAR